MEKIAFQLEDGEAVDFFVVEQARISGMNYILVTEDEEGDSEALILKDTSKDSDAEAVYEIVEDDTELSAVASVFESLLEDITLS